MAAPGLVVPTFREAASIGALVAAARAAVPELRVLVVDDGSDDGTADLAEEAGADVLRRAGARGLGPAYRAGFDRALTDGWDPVLQMDGDLSHDPKDLPRLIAALADADLALGTRWMPGGGTVDWGAGRRVLSRLGNVYARAWHRSPLRDLTGGFKAWRASALRAIAPRSLRCDGYAFQVEATVLAVRAGARVVEVPILFTERRAGASKMRASIAVEAAWRVPTI